MDTILLLMLPAGLWAQDAGVAATSAAPDATAGALGELATGLNTVWMLLAAMLVFFMQPGFALVEAGFIRTKNTANVLMKNLVDFMFGSILFWFIGFGLMFGIGGFVGAPHFFNLEAMDKIIDNGLPIEGFLIFQTVFCATAATIVSGAMAERTKFSMYLVYTVFISVLIYPVSGHWTWGGGWLMNGDEGSFMMRTFGTTFHDFAGSTVVHSVGGWIALVGAAILGPRIGKYACLPGRVYPLVRLVRVQSRFAVGSGNKWRPDSHFACVPHHQPGSLCRRFLRTGGELDEIWQTFLVAHAERCAGRTGGHHGGM